MNLDRWVELRDGEMAADNDRCKLSVVKANNVARFQTLNLRRVKDKGGYLVPSDDQERPVTARPRGTSGGASTAVRAQEKIGALEGAAEGLKRAAADAEAAVAAHKATPPQEGADWLANWQEKLKSLQATKRQAERMANAAELKLKAEKSAQSGTAPKPSGRDKAGGDDDR